jgi:hypothetical protein
LKVRGWPLEPPFSRSATRNFAARKSDAIAPRDLDTLVARPPDCSGYATSRTLVQVLKQCGDDLTRENVMKQAKNLKNLELGALLPGITINTGPTDYYPIEQMQLSRFNGEHSEPFGKPISGEIATQ